MARYRCGICGEIYDEDAEGIRFEDLPDDWRCPVCGTSKSDFVLLEDEPVREEESLPAAERPIAIDPRLVRSDGGTMDEIHYMSYEGKGPSSAMETMLPVPDFSSILFLGAQLARKPLDYDADVNLETVIGKSARKPMRISMPVFVSHMSFGALSGRAKIALAKGSAVVCTAMCSGEGGALYDEMMSAHRYIYEYIPNRYSFTSDTLGHSHAIEIKIGQGTKPGMGGHLPGSKVNHIIATMRGRTPGEDILSPPSFPEIETSDDLADLVGMLRKRSGGLPIGVKIAAGHIEEDLEFIRGSGCDFITIDGRGGATGSSPKFLKDASSVPTVYALSRARRFMDANGMEQELVITGGFRTSGDVIKAIAMGADAVAMASAPLMALGCQRYRACDSGKCPVGIATQDPELENRLDVESGAIRVANYLNALASQLAAFSRASGHMDVHDLTLDDLCTTDSEIAAATGIRHAR